MEWIKYTPLTPPPQGLKVLCFNEGDCWTAYSFNYEGKRIWVACVPHLMKEKIKKFTHHVGSSRVDLQACKLEYSIVSPK